MCLRSQPGLLSNAMTRASYFHSTCYFQLIIVLKFKRIYLVVLLPIQWQYNQIDQEKPLSQIVAREKKE